MRSYRDGGTRVLEITMRAENGEKFNKKCTR